jgi:Holliday junction resolvase RusA-like endonuclease
MGVLAKESVVLMDAFFVKGRPVPQGSLKFIHGRPIHARATDLAVWRADIARNAELSGYRPVDGGVKVTCEFIYIKPKTSPRSMPWVKPDLDKLIRAVLDGLTGVAYVDDSQVVLIQASKSYGSAEGVWITIEQLGV